jgi:hypothetical protein
VEYGNKNDEEKKRRRRRKVGLMAKKPAPVDVCTIQGDGVVEKRETPHFLPSDMTASHRL